MIRKIDQIVIKSMEDIKKYNVTFKGYRLEENASGLPEYSGIYMAYRCVYSAEKNEVSLKELIYIGQAENLQKRILSHKSAEDLHNDCLENEVICYAYASVSLNDLDVVENALIFAQQPRLNQKLKDGFNYGASSFEIEGECALLKHKFFSIN